MADTATLFRVNKLSNVDAVSLFNLMIQHKDDRLKALPILNSDQTRQLHDEAFRGSPHRICHAARMRQNSEQKGNVFEDILTLMAQLVEQDKNRDAEQERPVPAPIAPALSVVHMGAAAAQDASPAPGGKLLDFSAAAARPVPVLASNASPCASVGPSVSVGPPRQHIMVSYAWDDAKSRVVRFCDALSQRGIDVWRDETGSSLLGPMADAVTAHMAKAVEKCSFMIVCVSRKYMVSKSTISFMSF
jgi:hypothetical protein